VCQADNLPPSCAVAMKSGNLNFLEPSGPLQACNGTALPFLSLFNCELTQSKPQPLFLIHCEPRPRCDQTPPATPIFFLLLIVTDGPGSSVGIAISYWLDSPGIESRWGRDFSHLSIPALGPTQPPAQWVPGLSWGQRAAGA